MTGTHSRTFVAQLRPPGVITHQLAGIALISTTVPRPRSAGDYNVVQFIFKFLIVDTFDSGSSSQRHCDFQTKGSESDELRKKKKKKKKNSDSDNSNYIVSVVSDIEIKAFD